VRDTTADGLNLHTGWAGVTVEQSSFRNTGDDGVALWSDKVPDVNVTLRFNTVQLPILANAIAVYGGSDNAATDNVLSDTVMSGGGLHAGNRFGAVPLAGTLTLVRCSAAARCPCRALR
jgi:hypothetical protein